MEKRKSKVLEYTRKEVLYLMEIRELTAQSCFIPGRVNIGLWKDGNGGCFLIDSGGDETSGRRLFKLLQEHNLTLHGIINTHSNADHIGGNAYLQKKTSCAIITSSLENVLTQNPYLEPFLLWGAYPFNAIRGKFLEAEPSKVTHVIHPGEMVPGTELEVVGLPGHFLNMVGLKSRDGVFYVADSVFSQEIIEKYRFIVSMDVEGVLRTLDMLQMSEANWFVPSHAKPVQNITSLVEANRKGVKYLSEAVLNLCKTPHSREEILAALAREWGIEMDSIQYVLNSATIAAYLSFLERKRCIVPYINEGYLLWKEKV